METKTFANGIIFKKNENAPNFVIGKLSIKVAEATEFINQHSSNGWVNLDIKQSQNGKYYIELDTYKSVTKLTIEPKLNNDDLPF